MSGHRIGTAEVESALVGHPACAEAAVVPVEHPIKGQGIYAFITLMEVSLQLYFVFHNTPFSQHAVFCIMQGCCLPSTAQAGIGLLPVPSLDTQKPGPIRCQDPELMCVYTLLS